MQALSGIVGAAASPTGWSYHKTNTKLGPALVAYNKNDVTALVNAMKNIRSVEAMHFEVDFTGMTNTEIQKSMKIDKKTGYLIGFNAPKGIKTDNGMFLKNGSFQSRYGISATGYAGDFTSTTDANKARISFTRSKLDPFSFFSNVADRFKTNESRKIERQLNKNFDSLKDRSDLNNDQIVQYSLDMFFKELRQERQLAAAELAPARTLAQHRLDIAKQIKAKSDIYKEKVDAWQKATGITSGQYYSDVDAANLRSASKAAVEGQTNLAGPALGPGLSGVNKGGTGRKSGLSAGFSGKTGGFCWVARKVYGEDNPKWQIFRSWLCTQAPKWLYKAYGKYGESFAEWLDGKERTQKIIRKWMDKRIQKYLDTQPKTAQEIGPL